MSIKETAIGFRTYYKNIIISSNNKLEILNLEYDSLLKKEQQLYDNIKKNIKQYKTNFNINLLSYKDFTNNLYSCGDFYKVAKGAFTNRSNNYTLVSDLYDLYNLALEQKQLAKLKRDITLYTKITNLTLKDYTDILRQYYTEVHKKLILEGAGYSFGNNIGWITINRCIIRKQRRKRLNFAATKKREQELKAQGKRIYNKEEAEWCNKNGIEYIAEDKRVYLNDEYCYEIPLIGCTLPNGKKLKLDITDYRHSSIRGKTNEDLQLYCNNDVNKICELSIDLKTKLSICDKTDKTLYIKFIKNENQEPAFTRKINR